MVASGRRDTTAVPNAGRDTGASRSPAQPSRAAARLTSTPGPDQLNDFVSAGQPTSLLFGIDYLAVKENVQRPWPAQTHASGNLQFVFDALFQAPGLRPDVISKEAAPDFDGHSGLLQILPRTLTIRSKVCVAG
jgi:hypothetical protein